VQFVAEAFLHGWLKMCRYVRKGEKGIVILAPMVGRKKSDDELIEDAQTRLFGFRAAHVFDVTQTDGDPLPEFATMQGDPSDYGDRLKQFVATQNIALGYDAKITPAKGMSSGGKITLLPDLPPAEHFAVLTHEIAHELLHRGDRRKDITHTVRETEAEASRGLDRLSRSPLDFARWMPWQMRQETWQKMAGNGSVLKKARSTESYASVWL
jgi:antirestriction protein ArdC